MRALLYKGPKIIELAEVPEPALRDDEVVVDVGAVSICGLDMHAYRGHDEHRPPPLILGHVAAGVVF